jgi:hypothetical protein
VSTIQEKKQLRAKLLKALYEAVDGVPDLREVDVQELGVIVGVSGDDLDNAVQSVINKGFAEWVGGGLLGITQLGANEVEEAQEQGDADFAVEVATSAEVQAVEVFLNVVRKETADRELGREDRATLDAETRTLEAQLRSPRPNRRVLRAAVAGIAWVASSIGSGVLGNAAFEVIKHLGH